MTFCRVCGKLLKNVRFDPAEIVLCQKCADTMKGELVRVVMCKDCKNFVWDSISQNAGSCGIGIGTPPNYLHSKNWFCANGEKEQE